MTALDKFISENRESMLSNLTTIVRDIQHTIKIDPAKYTEFGVDEPSVDIRLCIDLDDSRYGYIFRVGLVDYDPYFSRYCGASCIGIHTNPADLLDSLIRDMDDYTEEE